MEFSTSPMSALQVVSVFGIGGGVGVIVGGMIGQWLYNKRRRYMPLFTGGHSSCFCSCWSVRTRCENRRSCGH